MLAVRPSPATMLSAVVTVAMAPVSHINAPSVLLIELVYVTSQVRPSPLTSTAPGIDMVVSAAPVSVKVMTTSSEGSVLRRTV